MEVTDAGFTPPPTTQLVDNAYSPLDVTDVVMVDPVGTGSRPAEQGRRGRGLSRIAASSSLSRKQRKGSAMLRMPRTSILVAAVCVCCAACGAQDSVREPAHESSPWSIDAPWAEIPDRPLAGSVFGHELSGASATADDVSLTITSEERSNGWPRGKVVIFADVLAGQDEWIVTPASDGTLPHVHMSFSKPGRSLPGTLTFTGEYSMRLEITARGEDTVRGKIHLSLPDYKRSYLVGEFEASIGQ